MIPKTLRTVPTLVANTLLVQNTLIGICHISELQTRYTTGIGEMLMHSDRPNCIIVTKDREWTLWANEDIYAGEMITVNKKLYGLV